jgi:predicted secreted protein
MKKFFYFTVIILLLVSCGKSSDDSAVVESNTAPTVPVLISPTNAKLCVSNAVTFQWNPSTDANKDVISYQIQVATDNQFTQIVKTQEATRIDQIFTLEKNKGYYWRIKATDSKNLSSEYSIVNSFYTEGDAKANHLPFAPGLVLPASNSILNSGLVNLSWTALDADTNDTLLYDIYLGTTNPPTSKIAENKATTTLTITANAATNYYWRVVVKDNKGGETIGQVWNFRTN